MTFRPEFLRAFRTELKRHATLAASSLAVIGGIALAPATPAQDAATTTPAPSIAEQIVAHVEPRAKAPSVEQLMPLGEPAGQSTYEITPERMANAKAIIQAGKELNMPPRA
ncbi:MAG TPA: hypothetical protein VIL44_03170, partial [Micromonospora sp.]